MTDVYVHPDPFYKRRFTFSILKAHLNNFQFLTNANINFDYFMMLASNCLFFREFDFNETLKARRKAEKTGYVCLVGGEEKPAWCHWSGFYKDKCIIKVFEENDMPLYTTFHEGFVCSKEEFRDMYQFIAMHGIENKITAQVPFEEILPATILTHYSKQRIVPICKVFCKEKFLNVDVLHRRMPAHIFCIKRVERDYNNPLRMHIRNACDNYGITLTNPIRRNLLIFLRSHQFLSLIKTLYSKVIS